MSKPTIMRIAPDAAGLRPSDPHFGEHRETEWCDFPPKCGYAFTNAEHKEKSVCSYDSYDGKLLPHTDCPMHGEARARTTPQKAGPMVADAPQLSDLPRDSTTAYRPPPDHYSTGAGIDPWAVWDAFDLDRYTANATKYLLRAGKKDGESRMKDLLKAKDYVLKAIEREEAKNAD